MRIALIDCGTNTFNLLIVELNSDKSFETIFRTSVSVKLGDTSINKGYISANSFQRGIKTLKFFTASDKRILLIVFGKASACSYKR
jgi:exopolyphosphatase/guanosine-5'-triphosphate,3'-diphosphate pyrophosphatase